MLLAMLSIPVVPVDPLVAPTSRPHFVEFRIGQSRCDGGDVAVVQAVQPLPVGASIYGPAAPGEITLTFRIDAAGRPLGIGEPQRDGPSTSYIPTEDLVPTLAAMRFAPGERARCSVTITSVPTPIVSATREQLYRFIALPRIGNAGWREATKRLRDEAPGNCFQPRAPGVLLRGYPDFDRIPQPVGTYSWAMTGFDIDANGRPISARILKSDGNAALDRAALTAVEHSRFVAGSPRTGCHYSYYRRQTAPFPSPPAPERTAFALPGATCSYPIRFVSQPALTYPEPFRRRVIQGWALVRYDVAPWGAPGNVEVVAAEPAAAFGQAARNVVAGSKLAPGAGMTGCVTKVAFKMADGEAVNGSLPPIAVD